ncbi:hypothetical protein DFH42_004249 [Clostridium beijerinckii]|nr:hypothetical protein [Clostridium beijerinckii]
MRGNILIIDDSQIERKIIGQAIKSVFLKSILSRLKMD